MNTSVIVVLRHACDGGTKPSGNTINFNSNITINNYGSHTVVDKNNNITIPINWLGCLGLKQAQDLGDVLKEMLANYCPVSRIITEDTGTGHDDDGTSNPLHTINSFANAISDDFKLKEQKNVQFDIYDGGDVPDPNLFNVASLLKDGIGEFSTVICWEAKGMWRQDDSCFHPDSILGLLGNSGPNGGTVNDYDIISNNDNSPYKGQTIYIFECDNNDHSLSLKMFNYDGSKPKESQITPINEASGWPTNLCPKSEQHDCN